MGRSAREEEQIYNTIASSGVLVSAIAVAEWRNKRTCGNVVVVRLVYSMQTRREAKWCTLNAQYAHVWWH